MKRDGSGVLRLTSGTDDIANAWSPDGTRLLFTGVAGAHRAVYVIDADGSNLRLISSGATYDDEAGSWAPDGKRIAIISNRTGNFKIYLMNADGSNQQQFTNTPESEDNPQWSPDGTMLAYTVITTKYGNLAFDATLKNVDGSGAARTIPGVNAALADSRSPSWSPDGTKLAFASRPLISVPSPGHFDIWTVRLDGTQAHQLTTNPNHSIVPRWSPDGTMLTYSLQVGLADELHLIAADGTDSRMLPASATSDYFAVWRP